LTLLAILAFVVQELPDPVFGDHYLTKLGMTVATDIMVLLQNGTASNFNFDLCNR
jgi:hypothetical protein